MEHKQIDTAALKQSFKQLHTALWFFLFHIGPGIAQQTALWGYTSQGGANGVGAIVRYDSVGANGMVQHSFTTEYPGGAPEKMRMIPYNGRMYGTTAFGGRWSAGVIFSWDPATNEYRLEHQFSGWLDGANPKGGLLLHEGMMYGTAAAGGSNDKGTIFSFNPSTKAISVHHHFDITGADGERPQCTLVYFEDELYGVTPFGGANNLGAIFSLNPATSTFTKRADMTEAKGGNCYGSLVEHLNDLWGVASSGGEFGFGSIFRFEKFHNDYFRSRSLASTSGKPTGSLSKSHMYPFELYATTSLGGAYGHGSIIRYNTFNNNLERLHSFNEHDGSTPTGDLLVIPNTNPDIYQEFLYGFTENGGIDNGFNAGDGVAFKFTVSPNGYEVIKQFDYTTTQNGGYTPRGSFAQIPGTNKLAATATYGGAGLNGILFTIDASTNGFSKQLDFGASALGRDARDRVVEHNGILYGVTHQGGQYGGGVLFSFDTATKLYNVLHAFEKATGWKCFSAPALHQGRLYGTTNSGGLHDGGVLYAFDLQAGAYAVQTHFNSGTGLYPGRLVWHNQQFWSTCRGGGSQHKGTIFSWNPGSGQLAKRYDFTGAGNFENAYGTLLPAGGGFYAVSGGGNFDGGALYQYDTAANTMQIRANFNANVTGAQPGEALAMVNEKVYGTCGFGGSISSSFGSVWEWNPANNQMTRKQLLSGVGTGQAPRGGFIEYNSMLYATTWLGGNFNAGAVLQYNPTTNTLIKKHDASNNTGTHPEGVLAAITPAAAACPQLGSDAGIVVACANDSTDITTLFTTTGFTQLNWSVANPQQAPVGLHRLIAINTQGCADTAYASVYNKLAVWTGHQNSEWTNPANWLNGELPTAEHHVIIPSGAPHWPVVAQLITVISLQVKNGATFQLQGVGNINTTGVCSELPNE